MRKDIHTESTYYRHIRKQHYTALDLKKGEFMHEKCDETFTMKGNLYRDMRVRHDVEPDIKNSSLTYPTVRPIVVLQMWDP